jgi:hypothetical protein
MGHSSSIKKSGTIHHDYGANAGGAGFVCAYAYSSSSQRMRLRLVHLPSINSVALNQIIA